MNEPIPSVAQRLLDICYEILDDEITLEQAATQLEDVNLVVNTHEEDIQYLEYWLASSQNAAHPCDAECFGSIGRHFATRLCDLNRNQWALRLINSVKELYQAFNLPAEAARCELNRATVLQQIGRYQEAIAAYTEAETVFQNHNLLLDLAGCRMNRANVRERLGQMVLALEDYDRALPVFDELKEYQLAAGCRLNRTLATASIGHYTAALTELDALESSFKDLGMTAALARCHVNRGDVFRQLGQDAQALVEYQAAEPLYTQKNLEVEAVRCRMSQRGLLVRMAESSHAQKRTSDSELMKSYADAKQEYDTIQQIFEKRGLTAELARCRANRAGFLEKLGQRENAIAEYDVAESLFGQLGLAADVVRCRVNRARIFIKLNQPANALTQFENLNIPALRDDDIAVFHNGYAETLWSAGQREQALEQFAYLRQALRHARHRGGVDETSLDFIPVRQALIDNPVRYAIEAGRFDMAFEAVQDGKASILGDLRQTEYVPPKSESDYLLKSRAEFVKILRGEALAVISSNARELSPPTVMAGYLRAWRQEFHRPVELSPASSESRLATTNWAESPRTLPAIQSALQAEWALLDFWIVDEHRILAFIVTATELRVEFLDNPYKQSSAFEQRLLAWEKATRTQPISALTTDDSLLDDLGDWFALFRPALKGLTGLYLVPHGWLHSVPLHAARRVDENDESIYLCDEFAIAYLPSAALLPQLPPVRQGGQLFSLANPERGTARTLPYADWEAATMKEMLDLPAGCFHTGAEATWQRTTEWGAATLIHLSCHGIGSPAFAPQAHLRLADDLLLAHDVLRRQPPLADGSLVILNGCETGVRDTRAIDEGMGLMSAFLLRGASLVLASQWALTDACAATIIQIFVREWLRGGNSPVQAFRTALLQARSTTAAQIESWRKDLAGRFPAELYPNEAAALQQDEAKQAFIRQRPNLRPFDHPIFWSAFYLIGRVA